MELIISVSLTIIVVPVVVRLVFKYEDWKKDRDIQKMCREWKNETKGRS